MFEKLKEVILDYQEINLDKGSERDLEVSSVPNAATVIIGVRRSGKSTLVYQRIAELLDNGVKRENILLLNFFDDRLQGLNITEPSVIIEAYYSLYPDKKGTEDVYCFFDEIQELSNWEPFVDRIMRMERCTVCITGSSAKLLSKEVATQMRGRQLTHELFPFSFKEFMTHIGREVPTRISEKSRLMLSKGFEDYWEAGGFPAVATITPRERVAIHQDYFNTALSRDVIERHKVKHPVALKFLARWFIDNIGSSYSGNKLFNTLRSQGHRLTRPNVGDYIEHLIDAFFFFSVRKFDASLSKSVSADPKMYCIDAALVTSTSTRILANIGNRLENIIFLALRRVTEQVFYFKSSNNYECDFVSILPSSREKKLIQVTERIDDESTREREIRGLRAAMKELNINFGYIVTRSHSEELKIDEGTINILPAWKFLLMCDEWRP
jgi:hypothetical protein